MLKKMCFKNNTAGIELDNIATTSGYNQMIDKSFYYINESSSCINLIFTITSSTEL